MQNNIEEINENLEKVVDGSKFDEIIEDNMKSWDGEKNLWKI